MIVHILLKKKKLSNTVKLQDKKTNVQKLIMFLYTNNKISEKNGKKFFLQLQQKIKFLVINLTKDVTDLYTENYKISSKEI